MAMPAEPAESHPENGDEALFQFRKSVLTMVRGSRRDLSLRQLAVILTCYTSGLQTVRGLSAVLRVQKPVITRAIDVLIAHKMARRIPDPADGRSVLVELTYAGKTFCMSLGRSRLPTR
ncbi:MarR family transcriptional regulator [Acidisoma sp. S159]|uniref:MarR family transcriptional regulator n=1 Tax=Acidisoma sp. S159 TaxID=1747225 RepID=UPI00131A8E29